MSRSKKGAKSTTYEYWSARPGNRDGSTPGKATKKYTHRVERAQGKQSSREGLNEEGDPNGVD